MKILRFKVLNRGVHTVCFCNNKAILAVVMKIIIAVKFCDK